MKPLKIIGLVFLAVLMFAVSCQRLYEMKVSVAPPDQKGPFVNPETQQAALVVSADIAGLQFKTDRGKLYSVQEPEPGQYWLFLEPGGHNLTISRSQFKNAKQMVTIAGGEVQELRISTNAPSDVRGDLMANRTELRLVYKPEPADKSIVGGVKGTPSKMDFSKGYTILHPLVGDRDMLVQVDQKQWAKTVPLKTGERATEHIIFGEGVVLAAKGGIKVTTKPAGASIFLDGLVQEQVTPLELSDIVVGSHEVEVVLDEYQPQMKVVQVAKDAKAEAHFNLKIALSRIRITSEPAGAELILDGEKKGATPVELSKLTPGRHTMELSAPFYRPLSQEITLRGGKLFARAFKLEPNFGSLAVVSEPSGIEVFLDNKSVGATPLELPQVLSGEHSLRLSLEHFQPIQESVAIVSGAKTEKSYTLKPNYGLVTILSTPSEADVVWVETDQNLGKTPLKKAKLPPGKHTLRVVKPQYEPFDISTEIAVDKEQSFNTLLTQMVGRLSVASTPPLANIFLNGEDYGQTPRLIDNLPTGEYELRLIKPDYEVFIGQVTIKKNEATEFSQVLTERFEYKAWQKRRNNSRLLSIILPTSGQFIPGYYGRGALYAGALLSGLYLAYDARASHSDSKDAFDDYKFRYYRLDSQQNLNRYYQEMEAAYDDMDKSQSSFNWFLAAAGGVYAWQIFDAWMWGAPKRVDGQTAAPLAAPYAAVNPYGWQVGLRINLEGKR